MTGCGTQCCGLVGMEVLGERLDYDDLGGIFQS